MRGLSSVGIIANYDAKFVLHRGQRNSNMDCTFGKRFGAWYHVVPNVVKASVDDVWKHSYAN